MQKSVATAEHEGFTRLLGDFKNLPPAHRRSKTILDVTGFQHSELHSSNLLAFLLDPGEEHGLGDLVLRSLLEAGQETDLLGSYKPVEVKVNREDCTEGRKRIDIVVETETFILGIENKIRADSNNPFQEYKEFLEARGKETGKHTRSLLLNLYGRHVKENLCGFKSVRYEDLFLALRKNIGAKLFGATPKHLFYLVDFITALENLKAGTYMDPHLLNFFKEHEAVAYRFYKRSEELLDELKSKSRSMKEVKLPRKSLRLKSKTWGDFFSWFTWCDIDLGNGVELGLQAGLKLTGWEISSYSQNKGAIEKFMKTDIARLGKWRKDDDWTVWVYASFPYEEPPETVKDKFQELLDLVRDTLVKRGLTKT